MMLLNKCEVNVECLYVEMCKRKNLLYITECWSHKYRNISEVNRFLSQDISYEDIYKALPNKTVIIDFMYYYGGLSTDSAESENLENAYCVAFILHPDGKIMFRFVGQQFDLTNQPDYAKISKVLFQDLQKIDNIVVCAEGHFNSIAITSMPYKKGFITDYFNVRNIGSVYDLIYPMQKRRTLSNALIVSNPDYGTHTNEKYNNLTFSEWEGESVKNTLENVAHINVVHLSGADATLESVKEALRHDMYSIIHYSTHGEMNRNAVGLVVSEVNEKNSTAMLWDSDAHKWQKGRASLAVYSLCFGAKQTNKLNDSLSGFIKFSLLSGADTVIAPLGRVVNKHLTKQQCIESAQQQGMTSCFLHNE